MDSNLSRHFGSARSAHSYDRHISSQSALSSFVTINQKRSWRPPPYLFQPVLDYMLDAAPLALAAANPFLRLYVERNENNGGFRLDGYQVTPLTLEQHHVACECGEGTAVRNEYGESGGLASLEDDSEGRSCGWNVYAGPYRGTSGMVAEEDGVGCGWGVEDGEESLREDSSDPRLSGDVNGGVRLIPLFLHGLGPSSGLSQASDHRYPAVGVDRVLPASTRSVVMSVKSNAPFATDARDRGCLGECWRSTAAELSLCVRVECKSQAALHFATLGAWWLSRYYGVSLRLQHMHPAQLASFKEVQRALFIKELHFEYCILSEDFIQCISTCVDLLSLSIISCSASQEVTLRCIDSILRKGNSESRLATAPSANIFDSGDGVSSADGEPPRSGLYGSSRATSAGGGGAGIGNGGGGSAAADFRREVSNWYLSGVRSLGSLRRLRCLHILHTPLHETFLQAIATCSSLECVILHRCRGVRSLEALQQLKRLQSLSLHGLSITDTDALSLGSFPALRQLVLDECRNVTDLSFLSRLRSTLERLFVPRTLLSNANMQHVGMLENLAELDVHSLRQLTELDALKDLTSLRALNARDNLITNQGCAALRLLPSVQRLDLSCCRCLTSLAAMFGDNGKWAQRLHSLNLSQTVVTDEGLHCLKECTELRYLNLSQCTAVQRLDFLRRMSALRWLHLGGTSIAAEEADRHLGSARSLRLLSLAGCGKMTSLRFATQLHHLEYLDLELTGVTDEQLEHLRGCRRLRFLSLQRCTSICWVVVLAELPALLELNISMTSVESSVRKLDSIYDNGQQRRVARSEGTSLASSYARMPSPPSPLSPTSPPTTSAPCSPRTEVPVTPNVRFASVQVLHLNGCGRITRLDTFVRSFPQLRILYADRISIAAMRGVVGFGYAGIEELRRSRIGPRHRGVRVNVEADAEDDRDDSDEPTSAERKSEKWGRVGGASVLRQVPLGANKSVSQLDQVLQQHVPQPPSSPRPRTAHSVGSRLGAHGQLFAAMPPAERGVAGEASRLLRLVLRRSSITDTILASLCANLCCVTALDLTKCTDVQSLTGISMLYALRELFLTQSSVDNNGVVAVSACVSLEVLRLTECRNVTDVNCLSSLGKLRALSMERTNVTSPGFVGVGGCRSLQFLTCSECRFLSDVNTLGSLQRLQELHLELTDVRDAGIRGLLKCSALQRVYFTRCKRLTTVGDMRAVLPQLEVLDVYGTSIPTRVAGQGQQFACAVM